MVASQPGRARSHSFSRPNLDRTCLKDVADSSVRFAKCGEVELKVEHLVSMFVDRLPFGVQLLGCQFERRYAVGIYFGRVRARVQQQLDNFGLCEKTGLVQSRAT